MHAPPYEIIESRMSGAIRTLKRIDRNCRFIDWQAFTSPDAETIRPLMSVSGLFR
jgi:hypothetical protein